MDVDQLVLDLRRRRLELGWTQTDVVSRIYCHQGSVSDWERGKQSPSLWSLRRWSQALDCDLLLAALTDPAVTDEMAGLDTLESMVARRLPVWMIAERLGISQRQVHRRMRRVA